MKTTEIFIEQVLIGFLVLLAFSLPYTREIWSLLFTPQAQGAVTSSNGGGTTDLSKIIGVSAFLVGSAYLLGTLFDRYADQILQPVERCIRTQIVIDSQKTQSNQPNGWRDPFPENFYRVYMLHTAETAAAWFAYLRSAVRLCRAMALLLPGVTLGAVLGYHGETLQWPMPLHGETLQWPMPLFLSGFLSPRVFWSSGILALSYFGLPVLIGVIILPILNALTRTRFFTPPRTDSNEWEAYAWWRGWKTKGSPPAPFALVALARFVDILFPAATWIVIVLLVTAFIAAREAPVLSNIVVPRATLVWVVGAILTSMATWVWWRVTKTFMNYLKLYALSGLDREQQSMPKEGTRAANPETTDD
jgi:hypothetical protein